MIRRFAHISLIVFLILILSPKLTFAKDYSMPSVNIDVTLYKDGSAEFVEKRTYSFNGNFSFGYYTLPKEGYESLEEFTVHEGTRLYVKNRSRNPETYYVEDYGSYYEVNFFYEADNEDKTFTFTYKLSGVVKVYEDYGEFYWKLQGIKWDKSVGKFESTIKLLSPVSVDKYFVWAHGPLWGRIEKKDEKTIYLEVENVPKNTFLEARILIPSPYFTDMKKEKGNIKEQVLKEEKKWAREANLKRIWAKIYVWVPVFGFFFFLFLFFYLYRKYGVEYKPLKNYVYFREPPSDIEPAVLGYLLSFGGFRKESLKATIIDLIRKGLIRIEQAENKKGELTFKYVKKENKINEFERILLEEILFDKDEEFSVSQLNMKIKRNNEYYFNKLESFKKEIHSESKKYRFFDKKSETTSSIVIGVAVVLSFAAFFLGSILANPYFFLWLLLVPVYIVGGLKAITRRSFKGKEEFDKWMAFKAFLNDFSNLKEYGPKSVIVWEKYLVYGTVLGVARNVLRVLKIILPEIKDIQSGTFIYFASMGTFSDFNRNFSNIDRSFVRAVTSVSSAYKVSRSSSSSWSGGGGGFSGGGGGGGGGSGGGMG